MGAGSCLQRGSPTQAPTVSALRGWVSENWRIWPRLTSFNLNSTADLLLQVSEEERDKAGSGRTRCLLLSAYEGEFKMTFQTKKKKIPLV